MALLIFTLVLTHRLKFKVTVCLDLVHSFSGGTGSLYIGKGRERGAALGCVRLHFTASTPRRTTCMAAAAVEPSLGHATSLGPTKVTQVQQPLDTECVTRLPAPAWRLAPVPALQPFHLKATPPGPQQWCPPSWAGRRPVGLHQGSWCP